MFDGRNEKSTVNRDLTKGRDGGAENKVRGPDNRTSFTVTGVLVFVKCVGTPHRARRQRRGF
jgi:hypothetical protein